MFNYVGFMRACINAVISGQSFKWVELKDALQDRAEWLNEFDFDSDEATEYFMQEIMKYKDVVKLHHIEELFKYFKEIASVVDWD